MNKVTSTIECFDGTEWSVLENLSNPEGKFHSYFVSFKVIPILLDLVNFHRIVKLLMELHF